MGGRPGRPGESEVRRAVAAAGAVLLVVEALAAAFVALVLGAAVTRQHMSLGGLPSGLMAVGAYAGGGVFAVLLVLFAVLLARIAVRDRRPGRWGRIGLVCCAVAHGVVAAFGVGLAGWTVFGFLAAVLVLVVLTLMWPREPAAGPGPGVPNGAA